MANHSTPRIVVVGAGSIGGYYAARVAQFGGDVAVVARGETLQRIRQRGLRVRSTTHGDWTARLPAVAPSEIASLGTPDWVWIATKCYQTPEAIESIRPIVGPETLVMSLQNGVDNEEKLVEAFGRERVLGAMTVLIGAHCEEPGVLDHVGESRLVFGEYPRGESPRVVALADFLTRHGVFAVVSADVECELWRKLMVNNALNATSALTRLDTRRLTHGPASEPVVQRMMHEVHAVGLARGVPLDPGDPDRMLDLLRGFDGIQTSMLWDLENGKQMEVEALVGFVVRTGAALGVPTPVNDLVYPLLLAMEEKRKES